MKTDHFFPPAYRHFVANGLIRLQPWTLSDTSETLRENPDFETGLYAAEQCKIETGAEFSFYLFARRHDRDDYAFFVVREGVIEDRVVTIHLSFVDKLEFQAPLRYEEVNSTFLDWVREVAIEDMKDWVDEESGSR